MAQPLTPDLCVIGAGAGGLTVAAAAAALGVPVVVIERHRMGGDCLNTGCVPSKALLAAAKRAHAIRTASAFGIAAAEPAVDFAAVMAQVRGVQAAIAPNDSAERFTALGVTVIRAEGRFVAPDRVVAGDAEIAARRFVIATGSVPAIPDIAGLAETPFLTTDTVWDVAALPRHLAIVGAGPVGCELAQAFRRLGARVTVLDGGRPLAGEDPECSAAVAAALAHEGVELRTGIRIAGVRRDGDGVAIDLDDGAQRHGVIASHLLIAAGRRPAVDSLGLAQAGIASSSRGIAVDRGLRTTNRRVYAIGDVGGGAMFTHLAGHQGTLVIRNALFRLPVSFDPDLIPRVTFTDPELAHIGLGEAAARARCRDVRVVRWPVRDNDRAQTEHDTAGFIKVVTTPRGRILGVSIVGAGAGEIIATWSFALARRSNIRAFTSFVLPYPTVSEIGRRVALAFFAPRLTSPLVKRLIGLLRWLG
ncbi:dihydrolipoyl dehydrogenase family protein [Blastochloris viridis]|uniref:Mercuric ion reductase n=1 Tax=Blastochloris viridis TaxID=1079 RepID=A0A0H5BFZ6_BLAVI|nr:FAD-dependent oxidoreductase [Blastochloris viridis]ALK10746.1 Mercuric reductase [Blastochloris viridis]BAR99286.1 mercuric ion reductase [Blastochloris viridis]CUU43408.1 Mercuric reductase [Blastochloris viridis]